MHEQRMNRRAFFQLAGVGVVAAVVGGCGPAIQVARVVVQVSWKYLSRVVKAVISREGHLIVAALVGDEEVSESVELTPEQHTEIQKGGVLILRTEDGKEHEVPFTVEK